MRDGAAQRLFKQASSDGLNFMNVDETLTTENLVENDITEVDDSASKPSSVSHRFQFHEDDLYGYIAAISEEDQKQGKAAGDVVLYRYRGYWDSVDHLEQVDANGRIISYDECSRPCVAIKSSFYSGRTERVAFNPSSIVGAAFQDAANGMLEVPPAPRPAMVPETQEASSEAQSNTDMPTQDDSEIGNYGAE